MFDSHQISGAAASTFCFFYLQVDMPKGGLEPPRVTSHAPQTCASTSSATSARSGRMSKIRGWRASVNSRHVLPLSFVPFHHHSRSFCSLRVALHLFFVGAGDCVGTV